MDWLVVLVGGAVALLGVVVAFLVDRRTHQRRLKMLTSPPDRPLLAGEDTPAYLTADQIRAAAQSQSLGSPQQATSRAVDTGLSNREQPSNLHQSLGQEQSVDLDQRLSQQTPIPAGWASADYVTDRSRDRAVLHHPIVLVADSVYRFDDLFPLIRMARRLNTGLVVCVRHIEADAQLTLALNAAGKKLSCLCVVTGDLDLVATRVKATVLSAPDVAAGYFPASMLGRCAVWVSDEAHSWIIGSLPLIGDDTADLPADSSGDDLITPESGGLEDSPAH